MKTTELLIGNWDKAEAARIAATIEREHCDALLLKHAAILAELHGLVRAHPDAQVAWIGVILGCSPRKTVWLLQLLRRHRVSFDRFHSVLLRCGSTDLTTIVRELERQSGLFSDN